MTSSSESVHQKVIIIGAGFHGLAAAKTYLDVDPLVDLLVIDEGSSVGGVWSESRIYPGLMYEMPAPMLNFSDMDMCEELGIAQWSDVSGYQVNEYITRYARKFGILNRCEFNTKVASIVRSGEGWKVHLCPAEHKTAAPKAMTCDKLIVATGITSNPRLPDFDLSSFNGFSFHAIDMGKRHKELVTDSVTHVTIVGGHKSALEAVGTCAQAGKKVEWLVREEGGGPTWMMPAREPDGSTPGKKALQRVFTMFTTSVYHSNRWIDRFFYSGRWWLGTWFISWFWRFVTKRALTDKYTKSDNSKKLKPHPDSTFWFVPGSTITHDRDLETLQLIDEENLIRVSRTNLVSAKGSSVTLGTGKTVLTDAIVFCTGWELSSPAMFSPSLACDLGLPTKPTSIAKDEREHWKALDTTAEDNIGQLYPVLKEPPKNIYIPVSELSPYRHFRYMVPPKLAARGDNSIVFLGNYGNARFQASAEIVSLWGVAYLEGLMPESTKAILANLKSMEKDIAHVEAYRKMRYLNYFQHRVTIFEMFEFDDLMLMDLGVRPDRKRVRMAGGWKGYFGLKAWIAELFEPYLAVDYKGIVNEFLESVEKRGGKGNDVHVAPPTKEIKKE